ncbi:16S rRNA (cytidine(1402)-2'-O)-methyltransferase [Neptunicella marina]|uniref:Ribosomal RNA small subunit methyltransferase I n=1 Tax=Neptunicella marina TaxID=2125989 RepID=A0A8J6ISX8_9ALTE|nr:16S rRNA (cytidine(1402)-2'-O)-methyltransferase [Neptunicella marina]
MQASGNLYIVATPIGNMADISLRAIETLNQVDLIAAEDTRHSQKLLQHHQIQTRLISVHEHNEAKRASHLISQLKQGMNIALISDAGTPLISDPGYNLVNLCRAEGLNVVPIPGACAAITALCAAGLATDRFRFDGFLPVKMLAREQALTVLQQETATVVFYEAPRRVLDTIKLVQQVLGDERQLVLAKELTKTFENFISGRAQDVIDWLQADEVHQKGEFVLMIAGAQIDASQIPPEAIALLKQLKEELPLKKAAAIVAAHYDLKKNDLYKIGLEFD